MTRLEATGGSPVTTAHKTTGWVGGDTRVGCSGSNRHTQSQPGIWEWVTRTPANDSWLTAVYTWSLSDSANGHCGSNE